MNKRGETSSEFFLMVWRIFLAVFVALVISLALSNSISSKVDVRENEVLLLSERVINCLAPEGRINESFDVKKCIDGNKNDYYVYANLRPFSSNFSNSSYFNAGSAIPQNCALGNKIGFELMPICLNQTYYVLIQKDNEASVEGGILNIYSGVGKSVENVER